MPTTGRISSEIFFRRRVLIETSSCLRAFVQKTSAISKHEKDTIGAESPRQETVANCAFVRLTLP